MLHNIIGIKPFEANTRDECALWTKIGANGMSAPFALSVCRDAFPSLLRYT